MDNLIEQLVSMAVEEDENYKSVLPLGKGISYFRMSECTVDAEESKLSFLLKLTNTIADRVVCLKAESSRYFFDIGGGSVLEVATIVHRNKITIVPYIVYFEENVSEHIQKNIIREYKVYQIFKQVGLQK